MKNARFKVAMSTVMAVMAGFVLVLGCTQDEESALVAENTDFLNLENASSDIEFMPLNTVPEWVKERVSGEEYEAWVRLSSRYEIDYSILTKTLTDEQKDELYQYIDTLWIQSQDSVGQRSLGYFTVAAQSVLKE